MSFLSFFCILSYSHWLTPTCWTTYINISCQVWIFMSIHGYPTWPYCFVLCIFLQFLRCSIWIINLSQTDLVVMLDCHALLICALKKVWPNTRFTCFTLDVLGLFVQAIAKLSMQLDLQRCNQLYKNIKLPYVHRPTAPKNDTEQKWIQSERRGKCKKTARTN